VERDDDEGHRRERSEQRRLHAHAGHGAGRRARCAERDQPPLRRLLLRGAGRPRGLARCRGRGRGPHGARRRDRNLRHAGSAGGHPGPRRQGLCRVDRTRHRRTRTEQGGGGRPLRRCGDPSAAQGRWGDPRRAVYARHGAGQVASASQPGSRQSADRQPRDGAGLPADRESGLGQHHAVHLAIGLTVLASGAARADERDVRA
jgi:hypothetical protein